jgi:hypothetical protein
VAPGTNDKNAAGPSSGRVWGIPLEETALPVDKMNMFTSRYMPCPDCGASLAVELSDGHVCDRERWLDYQLFQLRNEVDAFESELAAFLDAPQGRFAVWCAERDRDPR